MEGYIQGLGADEYLSRIFTRRLDDQFSWFDTAVRGFWKTTPTRLAIDLRQWPAGLNRNCLDSGIDYDIRGMAKPSGPMAPSGPKFKLYGFPRQQLLTLIVDRAPTALPPSHVPQPSLFQDIAATQLIVGRP